MRQLHLGEHQASLTLGRGGRLCDSKFATPSDTTDWGRVQMFLHQAVMPIYLVVCLSIFQVTQRVPGRKDFVADALISGQRN